MGVFLNGSKVPLASLLAMKNLLGIEISSLHITASTFVNFSDHETCERQLNIHIVHKNDLAAKCSLRQEEKADFTWRTTETRKFLLAGGKHAEIYTKTKNFYCCSSKHRKTEITEALKFHSPLGKFVREVTIVCFLWVVICF